MSRKTIRPYRPIQVKTGIYDLVKDLSKQHKTSMAGVVSYMVNGLVNNSIKLDWKKVREAYPDTRTRNQQQWARVDETMNELFDVHYPASRSKLVRLAARHGVSELQVKAWLRKQE